jgi:hypothetical protein
MHSNSKTEKSSAISSARKRALVATLLIVFLVAIAGGIRKFFDGNRVATSTIKDAPSAKSIVDDSFPKIHGPSLSESTSPTPVAGVASREANRIELSEVLIKDDACRLMPLIDIKNNDSTVELYLLATPFRALYEDYNEVLLGYEMPSTSLSRFYLGLAYANLLTKSEWKNPYKKSYGRAARILLDLARTDAGNAAPAAFALIVLEAALIENDPHLGISESEKAESIELLRQATKFDSYTLGYVRNLAVIDDQRVTSFLLRTQHLANLAVPDWVEFKTRWDQSQALTTAEKLQIVDLIAANAQNAKKPSNHLGYSYIESAVARSLAGNARAYQTSEEIDNAFPDSKTTKVESFTKLYDFKKPCGDPKTDPMTVTLREYVKELHRLDAGLGVSY